jgi:hypothetical protein
MATKKEKALVRELVELALEVNEQGRFDVAVDLRAAGVDFRISDRPWRGGDWAYYSDTCAYFENEVFTEAAFANRMAVFIHEAKKRHSGYDDDGIKM